MRIRQCFCGGRAKIQIHISRVTQTDVFLNYYVECKKCGAFGSLCCTGNDDKKLAVDLWNKRKGIKKCKNDKICFIKSWTDLSIL